MAWVKLILGCLNQEGAMLLRLCWPVQDKDIMEFHNGPLQSSFLLYSSWKLFVLSSLYCARISTWHLSEDYHCFMGFPFPSDDKVGLSENWEAIRRGLIERWVEVGSFYCVWRMWRWWRWTNTGAVRGMSRVPSPFSKFPQRTQHCKVWNMDQG